MLRYLAGRTLMPWLDSLTLLLRQLAHHFSLQLSVILFAIVTDQPSVPILTYLFIHVLGISSLITVFVVTLLVFVFVLGNIAAWLCYAL